MSCRCQRRRVDGVMSSPSRRRAGSSRGEGGNHGAVGPAHPRPWRASLEHGELVAQDEDLDLLPGVGSGAQDHPGQELGERHVDQLQCHQRIMSGSVRRQSGRSTREHSFGHPQGRPVPCQNSTPPPRPAGSPSSRPRNDHAVAARLLYLTMTRMLSWLALLCRRQSTPHRRDANDTTRGHGATPPTRPSPPGLAGPSHSVRPGQAPAPRAGGPGS
jgi:hypothetical protein